MTIYRNQHVPLLCCPHFPPLVLPTFPLFMLFTTSPFGVAHLLFPFRVVHFPLYVALQVPFPCRLLSPFCVVLCCFFYLHEQHKRGRESSVGQWATQKGMKVISWAVSITKGGESLQSASKSFLLLYLPPFVLFTISPFCVALSTCMSNTKGDESHQLGSGQHKRG
jgi:hypothetical protein